MFAILFVFKIIYYILVDYSTVSSSGFETFLDKCTLSVSSQLHSLTAGKFIRCCLLHISGLKLILNSNSFIGKSATSIPSKSTGVHLSELDCLQLICSSIQGCSRVHMHVNEHEYYLQLGFIAAVDNSGSFPSARDSQLRDEFLWGVNLAVWSNSTGMMTKHSNPDFSANIVCSLCEVMRLCMKRLTKRM